MNNLTAPYKVTTFKLLSIHINLSMQLNMVCVIALYRLSFSQFFWITFFSTCHLSNNTGNTISFSGVLNALSHDLVNGIETMLLYSTRSHNWPQAVHLNVQLTSIILFSSYMNEKGFKSSMAKFF